MKSRWLAPLLLVGCVLLLFHPLVLHPTAVLYAPRSDLVALHLPSKLFLIDSLRETGERPLWCPYRFCGDPFVADIQVAAFYPPHLLVPYVPRDRLGAFLSWLVVLHVLTAGLCAYAYARHEGLSPAGAVVAGVGTMFAGKWLLHLLAAGHYIVIGLAWFPLLLLCFEKALRGRSLTWATAAGAVCSLLFLGTQPQWVVYASALAVAWTAAAAVESADSPRAVFRGLGRWVGYGLWTVAVAGALGAVQLLPTREAAGLSSRARAVIVSFFREDGIHTLRDLVGPSLVDVSWEGVYGVALGWLMAGAGAVALARFLPGRPRLYAWALVGVTVLAVSNGGPLQAAPVFRQFRGHFRIFVLAALPLALLAGAATDRLASAVMPPVLRRRFVLWAGGAGLAGLCGVAWAAVDTRAPLRFHPYWFSLPLTFAALGWLAWSPVPWRRGWGAWAWAGLLAADAMLLIEPVIGVRDQAELYRPSPCVRFLEERRAERGRVLDLYAPDEDYKSPLGAGAPLALTQCLEAVRGYNPVDVAHFRDYLQFMADRADAPYPVEVLYHLPEVNRALVDLLNVRYRLHPDGAPPPGPGWRPVFRDEAPVPAFHHGHGGFPPLPPYTVYENDQAFPRAFVVPQARPSPARAERLGTLKSTDFRRVVLLDHCDQTPAPVAAGGFRPARIVTYQPNRVAIEATAEADGWLVLTDVWHPGWRVTVDGRPARLYRANYAFRAVAVPAGRHEVTFTFNPLSYRVGRTISLSAVAGLACFGVALALRRREASTAQPSPGGTAREAA